MSENVFMKKRATVKKAARGKKRFKVSVAKVTGSPIARLGNGIFVVRTGQTRFRKTPKAADRAGLLVKRLGRVLSTPGIKRRAVFGDTPAKGVYSYYVYDASPSKIVRESSTGARRVGRLVGGKFRAG